MSDSHSECTPVLDYLYVGGEDVATDREILASIGITAVVNCAADQVPSEFSVELGIRYLNLRMVDGNMEDLSWYVCEVIQFIRSAQLCGGKVLVHCHAGVSRSCALVIAYFMWNTGTVS
jgi:dual specificity MAP kinase phosphatase